MTTKQMRRRIDHQKAKKLIRVLHDRGFSFADIGARLEMSPDMAGKIFRGGSCRRSTYEKLKALVKETEYRSQLLGQSTAPDWVSATFKYNESQLEKLRAIKFYEDRNIQDLLAEALSDYFAKYEAVNGPIKVRGIANITEELRDEKVFEKTVIQKQRPTFMNRLLGFMGRSHA